MSALPFTRSTMAPMFDHPCVDVNAGTDDELRRRLAWVPHLQPSVADRIVAMRPFQSLEQLRDSVRATRDRSRSYDSLGPGLLRYLSVCPVTEARADAEWVDGIICDVSATHACSDVGAGADLLPMNRLSLQDQLRRMSSCLAAAGIRVHTGDAACIRAAWLKHRKRRHEQVRPKRVRVRNRVRPADDSERRSRQRREKKAVLLE